MYGIVMYLMPSISPRSWMRTTFLWVTWRASRSSRLKRRSSSVRRVRIARRLGPNDLHRDRDLELLVPRLIDGAHAADAEQLDDVISRAETLTDTQRTVSKAAVPGERLAHSRAFVDRLAYGRSQH